MAGRLRRYFLLSLVLLLPGMALRAQQETNPMEEYHRSSICGMLIQHSGQKYVNDVRKAYLEMPPSDKYNEHNIKGRVVETPTKHFEDLRVIEDYLYKKQVGKQLVEKWFSRDPVDGSFDVDLIAERGLYDASAFKEELSGMLKRGSALLMDAGEDLISHTFVLVYDIDYIDKEANAQKAAAFFVGLAVAAGTLAGMQASNPDKKPEDRRKAELAARSLEGVALLGAAISSQIAGFTVRIRAHLFQLCWDQETADWFYENCYFGREEQDPEKKRLWESLPDDAFTLKYLGSHSAKSAKTVLRGVESPHEVIQKVIYRAMDNSRAKLAKRYNVFRVRVPLMSVEGKKVKAPIGLKEGVRPGARFEVLERVLGSDGTTRYVRRGIIRAIGNEIWDNRFMSVEEEAANAELGYTSFRIVRGNGIVPGMLIREL